ncbi:lytic transglycosylase domain-containing protein [Desulfosoma caldarium]|uniref:Transglycosylase-like protein with SLT domain n=1 Tax=Desulfosoma caldarium TaxID=610254 RepID=A0A3N1UP61_9BACT|nr:lytic transglycosylase domain-containing protein [Desulfosoma caldarium]ROQ91189.1 transglycosylase-like protein with SLT domain [Desulfosoma caldarium]
MAAILWHGVSKLQEERAGINDLLGFLFVLATLLTVSTSWVAPARAAAVDPLEQIFGVGRRVSLPTSESMLAAVPVKPQTRGSFTAPAPSEPHGCPQERSIFFRHHPKIVVSIPKYVVGDLNSFQVMLNRAWIYLPIMKEILDMVGAPSDLLAVVFVESGFNGRVRSPAGAAGFWQLMPKTARTLGLRVDAWVDERLDPIKATRAAAVYLMDLYEQFGSWELALAAYNAGDGAVRRAIRRHRSDDFWTLAKKRALPHQTRHFVPKVLAAVEVLRNFERYGLEKPSYEPVWTFTTVWVQRRLSLHQASVWTGVPLQDLRRLNPALRRDQIPAGKAYPLRLPPAAVKDFLLAYERLINKKS